MTDEELLADREPIGERDLRGRRGSGQAVATSIGTGSRRRRTTVRDGSELVEPITGRKVGDVHAIDQVEGTVDILKGKRSEPVLATALIPHEYIHAEAQRVALMSLGTWVADHDIDADGPWRSARDLLLRHAPRVGQLPGTPLLGLGEDDLGAAKRLGLALDHSVLAIQGPPGSGKTFTGARMIVELVRAGKRVGVTANSHKVIGNLLDRGRVRGRRDRGQGPDRAEAKAGRTIRPVRLRPPTQRTPGSWMP